MTRNPEDGVTRVLQNVGILP